MERWFAGAIQAYVTDSLCSTASNVLSGGEWKLGRSDNVYPVVDRGLLRRPPPDGVGVSPLSHRTSEQRNHTLRLPKRPMRGIVQRPGAHATRAWIPCEYLRGGLEPGRRSFR